MTTQSKAILSALVFCSVAGLTAFAVREASVYKIAQKHKNDPIVQMPKPQNPLIITTTTTKPEPEAPKAFCKTSADKVMTACLGSNSQVDEQGIVSAENPLFIYGTTTAFENTANWKMKDEKGTVISEGFYTVGSPDVGAPGPFTAWIFYDAAPKTVSGTLMVYEASAKDGEPIHEVIFPVKFFYQVGKNKGCDELSGSSVTVYWTNTQKQKDPNDCTEVFPVKRTVCGDASSQQLIAVHELLKGPTAWEKSKGYTTNLPAGLVTPEIHWNNEGKFLDFAGGFEGVAGSCRVGAIRAQFEKTLGEKIGIGVLGETKEVLQP